VLNKEPTGQRGFGKLCGFLVAIKSVISFAVLTPNSFGLGFVIYNETVIN
jgi:hypothetical protein